MSGLDFLFEGKAPPSVSTYGQTISGLPQWLSDYTQGLVGKANAIGGEGYMPYEGPRLAGLTPDQLQAAGLIRGGVGEAPGMIRGAAQSQGALSAAAPYIAGANRQFPDEVSRYMSPYIENVTNRAATLAGRALDERLLPSLERTFGQVGSGVRSSDWQKQALRGTRDIAENLNEQNLAALHQGYGQAADIFGADASRQGTLAQVAGQLASNQRGQDVDIANALQRAGITEAGALGQVGEMFQGQQQKNLDTAYQDFLNQRNYPRETVDWMSSVLRGMPYASSTQTTGSAPATSMGPSPISQAASLGTGLAGLIGLFRKQDETGSARGGRIRRPQHFTRRGGLRYAYAA